MLPEVPVLKSAQVLKFRSRIERARIGRFIVSEAFCHHPIDVRDVVESVAVVHRRHER